MRSALCAVGALLACGRPVAPPAPPPATVVDAGASEGADAARMPTADDPFDRTKTPYPPDPPPDAAPAVVTASAHPCDGAIEHPAIPAALEGRVVNVAIRVADSILTINRGAIDCVAVGWTGEIVGVAGSGFTIERVTRTLSFAKARLTMDQIRTSGRVVLHPPP